MPRTRAAARKKTAPAASVRERTSRSAAASKKASARKPSARKKQPVRKAPARGASSRIRFGPATIEQLPALTDLWIGAYPMFITDRERAMASFQETLQAGYPDLISVRDGRDRIVGGYASYDFVATLLGRGMPAAGLGMVATALDRKKQHVALELVRDFVRRARKRKMPVTLLYPFRHDFYSDMGWGAVCQARQYRIRPSFLPLFPERRHVRRVHEVDWKILDRIHRQAIGRRQALGLSRHPVRWKSTLRYAPHIFLAGPEEAPEGYLLSAFAARHGDPDKFHYDLEVTEMEWVTPRALRALLGLLSAQRDQVQEIILNWPIDGNLSALLRDPVRQGRPMLPGHLTPGATVGHGVMLRLESPRELFRDRPYLGAGRVRLSVETKDPLFDNREIGFRSELNGTGHTASPAQEVTLRCGLSVLAQLYSGALTFTEAALLGLCEIAPDSACAALDRLFRAPAPWVTEKF